MSSYRIADSTWRPKRRGERGRERSAPRCRACHRRRNAKNNDTTTHSVLQPLPCPSSVSRPAAPHMFPSCEHLTASRCASRRQQQRRTGGGAPRLDRRVARWRAEMSTIPWLERRLHARHPIDILASGHRKDRSSSAVRDGEEEGEMMEGVSRWVRPLRLLHRHIFPSSSPPSSTPTAGAQREIRHTVPPALPSANRDIPAGCIPQPKRLLRH